MAVYFKVNEELVTSSGVALTGVYINAQVRTERLATTGGISIDIPAKANLEAITDDADSVFFRKKGTTDKVSGISDYILNTEQLAQMDFIKGTWVEPVKDALVEHLSLDDKSNIEVVTI